MLCWVEIPPVVRVSTQHVSTKNRKLKCIATGGNVFEYLGCDGKHPQKYYSEGVEPLKKNLHLGDIYDGKKLVVEGLL